MSKGTSSTTTFPPNKWKRDKILKIWLIVRQKYFLVDRLVTGFTYNLPTPIRKAPIVKTTSGITTAMKIEPGSRNLLEENDHSWKYYAILLYRSSLHFCIYIYNLYFIKKKLFSYFSILTFKRAMNVCEVDFLVGTDSKLNA